MLIADCSTSFIVTSPTLLPTFKPRAVDDGSGDVSIDEFIAVCDQVGVPMSPLEAQALFRRYGYESVMPYERFAYTLLTQPSRQLAEDMPGEDLTG